MRSYIEAINYLCNKKNKVSSHFLINKLGKIYYLVNVNHRANPAFLNLILIPIIAKQKNIAAPPPPILFPLFFAALTFVFFISTSFSY